MNKHLAETIEDSLAPDINLDVKEELFVPKIPSSKELATASPVELLEYEMSQLPDGFFPTEHFFTPGLYVRKIFMPAQSMLTSMKHKTEHPFMVTSGKVQVMHQDGEEIYEAPYMGITKEGTKRVLYMHEDTTWLTFHPNPENITDPDAMVEYLTEPVDNPLFHKNDPRTQSWKKNKYTQAQISHA